MTRDEMIEDIKQRIPEGTEVRGWLLYIGTATDERIESIHIGTNLMRGLGERLVYTAKRYMKEQWITHPPRARFGAPQEEKKSDPPRPPDPPPAPPGRKVG